MEESKLPPLKADEWESPKPGEGIKTPSFSWSLLKLSGFVLGPLFPPHTHMSQVTSTETVLQWWRHHTFKCLLTSYSRCKFKKVALTFRARGWEGAKERVRQALAPIQWDAIAEAITSPKLLPFRAGYVDEMWNNLPDYKLPGTQEQMHSWLVHSAASVGISAGKPGWAAGG